MTVRASRVPTSHAFPFLARNPCLAEDHRQQTNSDVTSVRIGDGQDHLASRHELMFAATDRSDEPETPEASNEVTALRRDPGRH